MTADGAAIMIIIWSKIVANIPTMLLMLGLLIIVWVGTTVTVANDPEILLISDVMSPTPAHKHNHVMP